MNFIFKKMSFGTQSPKRKHPQYKPLVVCKLIPVQTIKKNQMFLPRLCLTTKNQQLNLLVNATTFFMKTFTRIVLVEENTEIDEEISNETIRKINEFIKQTEGVNKIMDQILKDWFFFSKENKKVCIFLPSICYHEQSGLMVVVLLKKKQLNFTQLHRLDYHINFILSLGNMKSDFVGVKFVKHCACKIELTKIWTW